MKAIANSIILCASVLTALGVIIGLVIKIHKLFEQHRENYEELKEVKHEQKLMFTALCACLDGLEQLGANHTVPKAKAALEEWLNDQAHDE